MATGGAENFSFHSLQHRVLKSAKRGRQLFFWLHLPTTGDFVILPNGQQKKQQIFFRLTASACRRWRLVFSFESSGQVSSRNSALLNEVVRNYDFLLRPFLDNKRVTSEFLLSVFQMLNTAHPNIRFYRSHNHSFDKMRWRSYFPEMPI